MINFFSALGTDAIFEILKQSSDATAIYTGEDIRIQFANDAMLKIWNRDEGIRGKMLEEVLPELQGQSFLGIVQNVWKKGELYEARNMPVRLEVNGTMITSYFDFTYKPIMDKKGNVYCILHTAKDITERHKALELLQDREDELKIVNEGLSVLNNELMTSNAELVTVNKEFIATNKQLDSANREIYYLNDQLKQENQHLMDDNVSHLDSIYNLYKKNTELDVSNSELRDLNKKINQLNGKLTSSEMSFRDLITQAPVPIMLLKGKNFIVSMINVTMLKLIQKDISIIGKSLFEALPELGGQRAADMLINTFELGIRHSDDANPVMLNRNGKIEEGFFNFTYTPYIENGQVTGVIDMAVEVTSQVRSLQEKEKIINEKAMLESSLRKSEQRLRAILETMAEGVGVIDANGQMVYANPMAQQILGLQESEIKKRTYHDSQWQNLRLDGTALPPEEHPMAIMMRSGKPVYDHEIAVQPPQGKRIYFSINAAPMFDQSGELTGGIGTFMDVTARRLIAQGKDDFISIASHELKTPVTALKASLQLLQRKGADIAEETRSKLLDRSVQSLNRLTDLINDLLDTSRLEQGQMKIEKRPFTIGELFDDCQNFSQQTDRELIFSGAIDQTVFADGQQIGQVMVNLINNALKYAPDSDVAIHASLVDDSEIKISVRDNGPGIPEEKLAHLFERYYRTDYKGQRFSGLRLGLYISSDIIKNHGGRIGVESTLGAGTTFWFTLPLPTECN